MIYAKPLWKYISAREEIRLKKLRGASWPWTEDKILQTYKFTNVKRVHDRTTQEFLREYKKHDKMTDPTVVLYNCGVRRFFGTAEFSETVGWLRRHDINALRRAVKKCSKPWTGAYMIRAGAAGVPKVDVVARYLASLWERREDIVRAMDKEQTWQAGYEVMKNCYGFGDFMAKEVLQDYLLWLRHHGTVYKDDETFTPIGPGGRRGLNRLARRHVKFHPKMGRMMAEIRSILEDLQPLWMKEFSKDRLTAHDIQFCLCEFDKYERVRKGQGRPRSTYKPKLITIEDKGEGGYLVPKKFAKAMRKIFSSPKSGHYLVGKKYTYKLTGKERKS